MLSRRLRHHPRFLVLLQTGPPLPHAGAPGASTKDKPANDRASPRVAPVHLLRKGVWLPSADDDDGWGPLPFKAKEFVSCHLGM